MHIFCIINCFTLRAPSVYSTNLLFLFVRRRQEAAASVPDFFTLHHFFIHLTWLKQSSPGRWGSWRRHGRHAAPLCSSSAGTACRSPVDVGRPRPGSWSGWTAAPRCLHPRCPHWWGWTAQHRPTTAPPARPLRHMWTHRCRAQCYNIRSQYDSVSSFIQSTGLETVYFPSRVHVCWKTEPQSKN